MDDGVITDSSKSAEESNVGREIQILFNELLSTGSHSNDAKRLFPVSQSWIVVESGDDSPS